MFLLSLQGFCDPNLNLFIRLCKTDTFDLNSIIFSNNTQVFRLAVLFIMRCDFLLVYFLEIEEGCLVCFCSNGYLCTYIYFNTFISIFLFNLYYLLYPGFGVFCLFLYSLKSTFYPHIILFLFSYPIFLDAMFYFVKTCNICTLAFHLQPYSI